jgi:3-hydroxybutyryl-CoA dehydratase
MSEKFFFIGQTASLQKTITEEDVSLFADVTGDRNPIHLDAAFAQKTRFGGRIAHGILSAGLISAVLGMKLPGPGSIYLSQTLNFLHPVKIGDMITATVEVVRYREDKGIVTLDTRCTNQEGVEVLSGEAVLLMEEELHENS